MISLYPENRVLVKKIRKTIWSFSLFAQFTNDCCCVSCQLCGHVFTCVCLNFRRCLLNSLYKNVTSQMETVTNKCLQREPPRKSNKRKCIRSYLLSTPPNRDAFKHSGGDNLRWTSPTVTLYFDVELSNDSRPGTLQKTSEGVVDIPVEFIIISSLVICFFYFFYASVKPK